MSWGHCAPTRWPVACCLVSNHSTGSFRGTMQSVHTHLVLRCYSITKRNTAMGVKSLEVATIIGDVQVDHAIATLVLAFTTDPVARWMYDDPHQYLLHIPRLFRALGTSSFEARAAQRTNEGIGGSDLAPTGCSQR